MNFSVHELPKARADKRSIFEWLFERSPRGARTWLDAYDDILRRLEDHAASFGEALENEDCVIDVKQAFFKTSRGRVYRVLFFIDDADAYVLRVRGPGQAPVEPDEL
jgi:plasmid stabilization system protein ParE